MTMEDRATRLDDFLDLDDRQILDGAGRTLQGPGRRARPERVREVPRHPGPPLHQRLQPLRAAGKYERQRRQ